MNGPDDEASTIARAGKLLSLRRPAEALSLVSAVPGESASCALGLIRAFALLQLGRTKEGHAEAAALAATFPEEAQPQRVLAIAEGQRGRRRSAVAAVLRALALDPDDPDVLATASRCFREAGRPHDALRAARRLVEVMPGWSGAAVSYAEACLALKEYQGAEQAARHGLALNPEDPEALSVLATAVDRQGRKQEAVNLLVEAGRLDPTDQSVTGRIVGLVGKPVGVGSVLLIVFGVLQLIRLLPLVGPDGFAAVLAGLALFTAALTARSLREDVAHLSPVQRRGMRRERHETAALAVLLVGLIASVVSGPWSVVLLAQGESTGALIPLWLVPVLLVAWLSACILVLRGLRTMLVDILRVRVVAFIVDRRIRLPASYVQPASHGSVAETRSEVVTPPVNPFALPPRDRR